MNSKDPRDAVRWQQALAYVNASEPAVKGLVAEFLETEPRTQKRQNWCRQAVCISNSAKQKRMDTAMGQNTMTELARHDSLHKNRRRKPQFKNRRKLKLAAQQKAIMRSRIRKRAHEITDRKIGENSNEKLFLSVYFVRSAI